MKKIHLVELVSDYLTSEMPDDMISQYHPEIIKSALNMAYNQAVYLTWMNGKKFSDYSQLDAWTRTYSLPAHSISITGVTFSGNLRLPYPPLQLPNNMGIRQVAMATNEAVAFAYMENTAFAIFSQLDVFSIDDAPYFRLEQNDTGAGTESHVLKFGKVPIAYNLDPNPTLVDVKLIVPLDRIDDYEDVAIPAGQEDLLVKQTIEFLRTKLPEDSVNDQIANRPNQ